MLENKLFEALLDVVPFGAYAVDIETFEIVYANKIVRENMYAPQEEYCWEKLYGSEEKCSWCTIGKDTNKKQTCDFFDELDDRWIKSFDEFISWPDGRNVKYSILVDTTSQKEIEGSMIKSHAKLAVRSKQVAKTNKSLQITKLQLQKTVRELEEEKNKAQASTQSKSNFLANMSHEIRTPMNGIVGMTHLMKHTKLDSKQYEYVEKIETVSNNLLNIINDILDFSKIEAGKLEIDNINYSMKSIISNVSNLVELKAYEKDIKFNINYPYKDKIYFGDPLRIGQILINLVNNAIKFTHSGEIIVDIQETDNNLKFTIKDTGIGMSSLQIDKLFQSFSQADGSTTRKYGGTGLGLSISKQLVELMNGEINVISKVNVGSEFFFTIPLVVGDKNNLVKCKKNIYELQIELTALKGSTILLVEDNNINQEIIVGLLENSGIIIDIASNGYEAITSYDENNYELILMDIQMPVMDGYEATKIIRKKDKNIPIIALTANAMREDIEKTKISGMVEHLNKPINIEKLYETLLKYISKKAETIKQLDQNISEKKDDITIPEFINIDRSKGLSHMGEDEKLYLKILNNFYTDQKDLKLEDLDDKELEMVTHTIKGISSNIGAISLSEVSEKIESSLDKNLFSKFYLELNKVINELEIKLINNKKNIDLNSVLEFSSIKKAELLESLKECAKRKRPKICNNVLDEFRKYKLDGVDKKFLEKVENLISKYKYKELLLILEKELNI